MALQILNQPDTTVETIKEALGEEKIGITFDQWQRFAHLCNPQMYKQLPIGEVMSLTSELDSALDATLVQLRDRKEAEGSN